MYSNLIGFGKKPLILVLKNETYKGQFALLPVESGVIEEIEIKVNKPFISEHDLFLDVDLDNGDYIPKKDDLIKTIVNSTSFSSPGGWTNQYYHFPKGTKIQFGSIQSDNYEKYARPGDAYKVENGTLSIMRIIKP